MQNQNINSWGWSQGSSGSPFAGPPPVLPSSFPPPGAGPEQSAMLPGYHQMYGNPSVHQTDYAQWTSAQLQQWQQWQQWQEKYQQWQAQYGKKYAESLAAMNQAPIPNAMLPGSPSLSSLTKNSKPISIPNPPLPVSSQPVPPPPPEEEKPPPPTTSTDKATDEELKNGCQNSKESSSEELSDAEKTFDIQFKQWEGQFNAWKKENQDHPDKEQYKEYEKKWETWREQLLQRREQMRKKRLGQAAAAAAAAAAGLDPGSSAGRNEEAKKKSVALGAGLDQTQTSDASNQTLVQARDSFSEDDSKFKSQQSFEKSPVPNQVTSGYKLSDRGPNEGRNNITFPGGSNFGTYSVREPLIKQEFNKPPPFQQNSNLSRSQGQFGNQGGGFSTVAGQLRNYNQGLNFGFGHSEGATSEGSFNSKSRSVNQQEGSAFEDGKRENFSARQRFGSGGDRHPGIFGPPSRFFSEKFDKFRNGKNFGFQRLHDCVRDKEAGLSNFGKCGFEDVEQFRAGQANRFPEVLPVQNLKPKVPSLFDITVEKPPGLMESNAERKGKFWEKSDREQCLGDFTKRESERDDRNQRSNCNRSRNLASSWMQPWDCEKMNSQSLQGPRDWNRGAVGGGRADGENFPKNREIATAELSGYVGNILAKLGHLNAMPTNSGNVGYDPFDGRNSNSCGISGAKTCDLSEETRGLMEEYDQKSGTERNENVNSNIPGFGGDGGSGDDGNGEGEGDGDGDGDGDGYHFKGRNKSVPEQNYSESDKNRACQSVIESKGGGDHDESRNKTRASDDVECVSEPGTFPFADIDERTFGRNEGQRSEAAEGGRPGGPFRGGPEEVSLFGRGDSRNFSRPFFSKGDRRSFGNEDKSYSRDDGRSFVRSGREERQGGFFKSAAPRDDVDDRFPGNRGGRRSFDRFPDRDDGDVRGFAERFPRNRDRTLGEPVWNPQVFDYSLGRPQRVLASEKFFKISTVVDYSHGENKQTFDYGHGDSGSDKREVKSFDYGHGTEFPTVIDYGHGVKIDPDKTREEAEDRGKTNSGFQCSGERPRSPKGSLRSRSRSPSSKPGGDSASSSSFKEKRFRGREGSNRYAIKRGRKNSEGKSPQGDNEISKHSFDVTTVLVEDLICLPGRETRPNKLVFIMRGIPGSGKTYVTKLIKDKETEMGGDPPRILSLDDYFMTEVEKEIIDEDTGRRVKSKLLEYEYEAAAEPHYRGSLIKAFKKTISDGFFSFVIVDSVNEKTQDYEEMWSFAKQKGFQVYVAEMDNDVAVCTSRNIHKRTEKEISDLVRIWEKTPPHYLRLDVRSLLQSDAIAEVEMEVVGDVETDKTAAENKAVDARTAGERGKDRPTSTSTPTPTPTPTPTEDRSQEEDQEKVDEEEDEPGVTSFVKSRWDHFENSERNLDRLDGLKRRREGFHATMEDYLQLPDDSDEGVPDSVPGRKRVRWADLEERRQQEKMRAIGFVVGQTDWSRMTDPTFGESALTRTKYI